MVQFHSRILRTIMKKGRSIKIMGVVITVLVAGFIGFQTATKSMLVKLPRAITQQQTGESGIRQRSVSKMSSRPNNGEKAIQDEQDLEEQIDEFPAHLDAQNVETLEAIDMSTAEIPLEPGAAGEKFHGKTSSKIEHNEKIQQKETMLQRYLRIKSTPEFKTEWNAACGPIFDELNRVIQERDTLREKEKTLKERLTNTSEENRRGVEEELEAVQVELKDLDARVQEVGARAEKASWEVHLQYFTREERMEALKQMAEAGMIPILK